MSSLIIYFSSDKVRYKNISFDILMCFLIVFTIWGPYFSSWLIGIFPFTAGAIFRDIISLFVFIISATKIISLRMRSKFDFLLIFSFISIFCYTFIYLIFSPSMQIAFTGSRPYIFYSMISLFCYFNIKEKYFSSKLILSVFLFNLVLTSLIALIDVFSFGIFTRFLGYDPLFAGDGTYIIFSYLGFIRANGGFSDALNFGYYLVLGLIVCLYLSIFSKKIKLYFLLIVLLYITILLTFTRGAILAASFAIILHFFKVKNFLKSLIIFLSLSIIFVGFLYFSGYSDILLGRFTGSEITSKESSQTRIVMAINAISFLVDNPLGVGLGTQGIGSIYSGVDNRINTDNTFFWVALEIGIVGSMFYFLFIGLFFCGLYRQGIDKKLFISLLFLYFISASTSSAPMSPIFGLLFTIISCQVVNVSNYKKIDNSIFCKKS